MPKVHQKFSASSAPRWIACPGSIAASEGYPPQKQNDFADEGTGGHLVLEYCQRFDCAPGDADVIVNGKHYEVDDEMKEAVQTAIDIIKAAPGELIIEEEFLIADDLGGTIDAGKYDPEAKRVYVFDFKYGRRAVQAVGNPQLAIYAMGMLKKFPEATKISMIIIQPRVTPPIVEWTVGLSDFAHFTTATIMASYKEAKQPNAPRCAGTHCRYCPALVDCPTSRSALVDATRSDFDLAAAPVPINLPPVEAITNEQAARLLEFADLIADYCKAVKEVVHSRLMSGQKIPGWKVVQKRANRQWKNEEEVALRLSPIIGPALYTKPEMVSPAQVEKALKASGTKFSIDELTHKPDNGLSIAPESDKRKEVVPQIGSDFAGTNSSDLI